MSAHYGYGGQAGKDALIFAYDTGDTQGSYKGEPTTNLLGATGDMAPPNPETSYDISTAGNATNVNGTSWDLSVYPNSNVSSENGVSWDPTIKGPGFTGAWKLKKRPGGNGETQFANGLGSVNNTTAITLSVWCKATVAGVARIHTNTTRNGSSYWGYASGYHTGDGTWQKLTSTIPAGSGVTSINVIRCQVNGTTINTDVYWRHYQIEYNSHPTQFTAGTRSATQGLLDLTGNTSIDLTNAGFDSNAQLDFDGTNTYIPKLTGSRFQFADTNLTYEVVVNFESNPNLYQTLIGLADTNDYTPRINFSKARSELSMSGVLGPVYFQLTDQNGITATVRDPDLTGADLAAGGYYHYAGVIEKPSGGSTYLVKLYRNGELVSTLDSGRTTYDTTQNVEGSTGLSIGSQFGNLTSVLDGQLPVVKVYNRALTAAEVKQNYNNYKGRFNI